MPWPASRERVLRRVFRRRRVESPCSPARRVCRTRGTERMHRRYLALRASVGVLSLVTCASLEAQDPSQWGYYSASRGATRYSPLAQIDASNVGGLGVVWRHKQADPAILAA